MPVHLSPGDRLIVLAPHPDDESLATGGLILRALSLGAAVHVVLATNGDNNPWPQRWVERRWKVGPEEQQRWGNRRNLEARAAIAFLGLPENAITCLNLPDQGTSRLLHERNEETICRMAEAIAAFRPTHCAIPSPYDLHRDHNALHLLWQIAERRAGLSVTPEQLHYLVHFRPFNVMEAPPPLTLQLTDEERQKKYDAILCHQTQMVLSKKRFLGYARAEERYHAPLPLTEETPGHRVCRSRLRHQLLRLSLLLNRRRLGATLELCGETADNTGLRCTFPIPFSSGKISPKATTHPALSRATIRIEGRQAELTLPLPDSLRLISLYAKLQRPTLFLDETGWRAIPLGQAASTSSGASDNDAEAPA